MILTKPIPMTIVRASTICMATGTRHCAELPLTKKLRKDQKR